MRRAFRLSLAGVAAMVLAAIMLPAAMGQASPGRAPEKRSIPFVSITRSDGTVRYYETNAIPLLADKACFGWRTWLGGPDRTVSLIEILQTSAPARDVIAGPDTEVSPDKTRSTTRMRERVVDGYMMRSWCIDNGDPPGTYTYHITIDGDPRGEFVFCAIEMKDQDETVDPTELTCPNKFHSVEYEPVTPRRTPG